MEIEGAPTKKFRLFRTDSENHPLNLIAEYDTAEEVLAHKRRLDWLYLIQVGTRSMRWREFEELAKSGKL